MMLTLDELKKAVDDVVVDEYDQNVMNHVECRVNCLCGALMAKYNDCLIESALDSKYWGYVFGISVLVKNAAKTLNLPAPEPFDLAAAKARFNIAYNKQKEEENANRRINVE